MEYTILILALPILSFLILALTGMYMHSGLDRHTVTGRCYYIKLSHRYQLLYSSAHCRRSIPDTDSMEYPVASFYGISPH